MKNFNEKDAKLKRDKLLAEGVTADFERRRKERLKLERQWELNMNFLSGNQYCDLNFRGDIVDDESGFYWQNRETFNRIAPLIESRLARFSKISPILSVRPKSDDDAFVTGAGLAEKIINEVAEKNALAEVTKKVTVWSETCGSGFYKVVWDNDAGDTVATENGKNLGLGEVKIVAVSPFSIFPDSLYCESVDDCLSIIFATALPVSEIKRIYGKTVSGGDVGVFSLKGRGLDGAVEIKGNPHCSGAPERVVHDSAVVIERYERPSVEFPNGRLITVADGQLLYSGELPYALGENGKRAFPFIKQDCVKMAGSFFGASVIERLIPVQRAFNAVKNRKHEFLNRLSLGVMTVEDGSVDVDDLREEGLPPGKILVYRQGANLPQMMKGDAMPKEFADEEEKLSNEFVVISGVADVSSASSNAAVSSGSALEILVEQDNERLLEPAERIRKCVVTLGKFILRLYAQFVKGVRPVRYRDSFGKTKLTYADGSKILSDDVYLENENELLFSEARKKENVFKLYESGLLADADGKLRSATKEKVLSLLGYKDLDYQKGVSRLQEEKATAENDRLRKATMPVEEVDDDNIHIEEHTRFILSEYENLSEKEKANLYAHLKAHKDRVSRVNSAK